MSEFPSAYLLTFSTYGTRLHGDERGSVNRERNGWEEPMLLHNLAWSAAEAGTMKQPPYVIDDARRGIITDAIKEVCEFRGWSLLASNVRSNHIHVIVQAFVRPERVVGDLKMMASRRLAEKLHESRARVRWTRHGSTRYLWTPESVGVAVRYVVDEQGAQLEAYENTGEIDL